MRSRKTARGRRSRSSGSRSTSARTSCAILEKTPIDYTVLIGEQDGLDASRAFGMQSLGLPYTVFVDSQGRIVTIHLGELHRPQADVILSLVRAIDAGQIDLPTAQARIKTELPKIG